MSLVTERGPPNGEARDPTTRRWLRQRAIASAACYVRHTPVEAGRWRLRRLVLPLLRSEGRYMGCRVVRCSRYGFRFKADLSDWLGQYVYLTGTYEPATARVFARLVEPGSTVLDIGANSGFFTLLAAVRTGPAGRVLAFEPVPTVRAALEANLALNGARNVTVYDVAVSNQSGQMAMFEGPLGHKGLSSLRPLERSSHSLTVPVLALDDLADELTGIKLAKIDVEGAELKVLRGMVNIIARDEPNLIFELTDSFLSAFGDSAQLLQEWLRRLDYSLFHIIDKGLCPLTCLDSLPGQCNILAVPGQEPPASLMPLLPAP